MNLAKYLLLEATILILFSSAANSLGCPCNPVICHPPQGCQYGEVPDVCACCMECAKGPGETCGGTWGELGTCGNGTQCMVNVPFGSSYSNYRYTPGTCVSTEPDEVTACSPQPSPSALDEMLSPSPSLVSTTPTPTPTPKIKKKDRCRVNCNVSFCYDGKNKFCSAITSGVDLVDGRHPCQHTTCRACHLIVTPSCPRCPEPVNKRCLRHYFLCIEQHFQRNDTILALHDPRAMTAVGKINCYIPELLQPIDENESGNSSSS